MVVPLDAVRKRCLAARAPRVPQRPSVGSGVAAAGRPRKAMHGDARTHQEHTGSARSARRLPATSPRRAIAPRAVLREALHTRLTVNAAPALAMVDQSLVQSGFDTELLLGPRTSSTCC